MEAKVIWGLMLAAWVLALFGPNIMAAYLWMRGDARGAIGEGFMAPWTLGFVGIVSLWWADANLAIGLIYTAACLVAATGFVAFKLSRR